VLEAGRRSGGDVDGLRRLVETVAAAQGAQQPQRTSDRSGSSPRPGIGQFVFDQCQRLVHGVSHLVEVSWLPTRDREALVRGRLGSSLLYEVSGRYAGKAPHLAAEMGLVGVSGIGCRCSEWHASISSPDESLETQHFLEHLGAEPNVFQEISVEMPRADGERSGNLADTVSGEQPQGCCDPPVGVETPHPVVQITRVAQPTNCWRSDNIFGWHGQVAKG
jgi:hypothetical protein